MLGNFTARFNHELLLLLILLFFFWTFKVMFSTESAKIAKRSETRTFRSSRFRFIVAHARRSNPSRCATVAWRAACATEFFHFFVLSVFHFSIISVVFLIQPTGVRTVDRALYCVSLCSDTGRTVRPPRHIPVNNNSITGLERPRPWQRRRSVVRQTRGPHIHYANPVQIIYRNATIGFVV